MFVFVARAWDLPRERDLLYLAHRSRFEEAELFLHSMRVGNEQAEQAPDVGIDVVGSNFQAN